MLRKNKLFSTHTLHKIDFARQDYKVLKVLPNELPQDPDIEKVKKEEYVFKTAAVTPVESNEIDSVMPTGSTSKTTTASAGEPFMEIISSVDSSNEIDDNPPSPTEGVQIMIIERKDLEKTVTQQAPEELILPALTGVDNELRAKEAVTVFSTNATDHDKENLLNLSNGGVLEGSIFQTFHFDEKDDESDTDEDYSTELVKPPRPTEYTSKQRTMPSSTLLHGNLARNFCSCAKNLKTRFPCLFLIQSPGFISNPGYPSFYIGKNKDCKWKIKLNEGHSIALTILDLHLRSEWGGNYFPGGKVQKFQGL